MNTIGNSRGLVLFTLLLTLFSAPDLWAQSLDHFTFSTTSAPQTAYVPFRVTITARSSTGATVRTYTGTPQLVVLIDGVSTPIETFTPVKFTSGVWNGTIVITQPASGATLRVRDISTGRNGLSIAFDVRQNSFRVLDLPVISIASDLSRGVLYASAGPTNGPLGSIHVIDPANGAILETHQFVGGVERVELSKDASKLYIVTDDQKVIRRLSLPSFSEDLSFGLGEIEPGVPHYAADLAIDPGNAEIVAVVKKRRNLFPWFSGLAVFENTSEKLVPSAFIAEANVLEFGDKPGRLYGHYNQSTPNRFSQFDLSATELTFVETRRNLFSLFDGDIHFVNGKLYCTTGRIIDPEAFTILGELPGGHDDALMLPLPDRKRIVYFTPATLGFMLTYNSDTLQRLDLEPFPVPRGYGSGVAFWGDRGIAFHDGARLYLTENRLIPTSGTADLAVSVASAQDVQAGVGVDHPMRFVVRNLGPNNSGAARVIITGTADIILTAATATAEANITVTDRTITVEFADILNGSEVEVTISARANLPAWFPITVVSTADAVDPVSSNNAAGLYLKASPLRPDIAPIVLGVPARAVAAAPNGRIFIAPTSVAAPWANSIVEIDPVSGEIGQPRIVGTRPQQLAVSDNGEYLYVGFGGLPVVHRYTLPALQHDLTIPLGADGFVGPRFPGEIKVRPGHPTEFAVTRYTISADVSEDRLGYFRDATDLLADRSSPTQLEFFGPDRLYAYEPSWGVFDFSINQQGLTWNRILRDVDSFEIEDFVIAGTGADAKIYLSHGTVFNAETGTRIPGDFFFFGPFAPGPIVDLPGNRALFLQRSPTNYLVTSFNLTNHTAVATNSVPVLGGIANSFERWSANGLAFSTSAGVAILHTDLLGNPETPTFRIESISRTGNTFTFAFDALPTGQYILEQTAELSSPNWIVAGEPFAGSTTQVTFTPIGSLTLFFRLNKFQ